MCPQIIPGTNPNGIRMKLPAEQMSETSVNKRIGLVLDGKLCSAPVIRSSIHSETIPVEIPFPEDQAKALVLRINEAAARSHKPTQ